VDPWQTLRKHLNMNDLSRFIFNWSIARVYSSREVPGNPALGVVRLVSSSPQKEGVV
jgi:hypothetical protein